MCDNSQWSLAAADCGAQAWGAKAGVRGNITAEKRELIGQPTLWCSYMNDMFCFSLFLVSLPVSIP